MNHRERQAGRAAAGWRQTLVTRMGPLGRVLAIALAIVIATTSGDSGLTQVERIEARGNLVMLTVNGASTYYLGPEGRPVSNTIWPWLSRATWRCRSR